ncbi:MAG: MFS transporter [Chloroflexota bacterium]
MTPTQPTSPRVSIYLQLFVLMLSRLILNISLRMVYPFAPALARGLNVPLASVTNLITLRNISGMSSPLFGPLSERYGRRPILILGLVIFGISSILIFYAPFFGVLGFVLIVGSLGKVIFDPAMQSYIGDTVPYKFRGRAISFTELSWAGGLFIGGPVVGWLIATQGWRAPFLWLGILAIVAAAVIWIVIDPPNPSESRRISLVQMGQVWRQYPVIRAAAFYVMFVMAANETLFIVYGSWMEVSFNLSLAALGVTTTLIGVAEIIGEFTAGFAVDRFGKRQVILITGTATAVAYLVMPLFGLSITSALVLLFIMFLVFEITVVGAIPLMTELVPSYRAIVMASNAAFGSIGRAIGSTLGPWLWQQFGYQANGVVAMVMMIIAIIILYRNIHEYRENDSSEITE